ncbi:MAG: hypothetical protein JO267_04845 [Alphaproteobacteria bacterium]|nr:hypothetical protein [Alphaproteobacteria bacterium]
MRLPAFLQGRSLQYEIHVLVEGRWRIDEIVAGDGPGGELDPVELEQSAIERAQAVLSGAGVAAVKVVRERRRADGFATTREVFAKEAPPAPKEPPLAMGRLQARPETAICQALPDLYRRESCRMISILMRSFLDRLTITPLELLHYGPYARKLEDNWGLVGAAVNQLSQLQAQAGAEQRAEHLKALIDQGIARARAAESCRRLPAFAGNWTEWGEAIGAVAGEDAGDRRFYLYLAIARHLAGMAGYIGRLDFAVSGLEQLAAAAPLVAELDAFSAGCLESPQLVMDLLGPQPNLAAALLALADLAAGRFAAKGAPDTTVRLQERLRAGQLVECVPVLWERIERQLAGAKPLSRTDPEAEWPLMMRLMDDLPAAAPEPWRARVEAALARRVHKAREMAV